MTFQPYLSLQTVIIVVFHSNFQFWVISCLLTKSMLVRTSLSFFMLTGLIFCPASCHTWSNFILTFSFSQIGGTNYLIISYFWLKLIILRNTMYWVWRDGSAIKCAHCSCRGCGFSPRTHIVTNNCLKLQFQGIQHFSGLQRHHMHRCTGADRILIHIK